MTTSYTMRTTRAWRRVSSRYTRVRSLAGAAVRCGVLAQRVAGGVAHLGVPLHQLQR
ncbi:hypothetical protein ABZ801_01585 [Actinomadura sp. NPDC047616]|uniref:hypothetical protein n=1 Tax=Actinomadura sp. NPDC047616 TaxID=3155914 RepID=UPI003403093D